MTQSIRQIDTRLVCGFPDAGKTTYITDCIENDRFYKRGSTLVLSFEQGETGYDVNVLTERNALALNYTGGDVRTFCEDAIANHRPDRIYVEMNASMLDAAESFPDCMKVTFTLTLIDWDTFQIYYATSLQTINQMVSVSDQVIFRGCPMKKVLAPYSQAFRLMNPKASYLRKDPMGYHEKAFDLFLPFSLDGDITISEKEFLPLWLDSFDHPEHYDGKIIHFTDPLEIRRNSRDGKTACGRVVMTCCMADLQFMSFELQTNAETVSSVPDPDKLNEGWAAVTALAKTAADGYGQKKLVLIPKDISRAQTPEKLILDSRR